MVSWLFEVPIAQVGVFGKIWSPTKPGIIAGRGGSLLTLVMDQLPVSGSELTAGFEEDAGFALNDTQPGYMSSAAPRVHINRTVQRFIFFSSSPF